MWIELRDFNCPSVESQRMSGIERMISQTESLIQKEILTKAGQDVTLNNKREIIHFIFFFFFYMEV